MPDLAKRLPVPALGPISRAAKPLALALATASLFLHPGCAGITRQSQIKTLVPPLVSEPIGAFSALDWSALTTFTDVSVAEAAPVPAVVPESVVAEAVSEPPPAPEPAPAANQPAPAPAPSSAVTGKGMPYDPDIERWRPLVRQELAQAGAEGLLTGPATRLDEDLLLAMMEQESGGDPTAESWAGAMGLMQLMPGTFAGFIYGDFNLAAPRETILDPTLNVRAGVRYMADALQQLGGDLYWSVSSYNAGTGAAQDWLSVGLTAVPPIGGYWETAAYAPAILSNYAAHRPDVAVSIPAPITEDQIPGIVALLTTSGLW